MKNKIRYLLLFIVIAFQNYAQINSLSFEKEFNTAEDLYASIYHQGKSESDSYYKGGYSVVRPLLINLYRQDTTNMSLAFKIGVCYLSSRRERSNSIYYFLKASKYISNQYKENSYKEKNAPTITYKFLGDAYHLNCQFDEAIVAYQYYLKTTDTKDAMSVANEAQRGIEICKTAKLLVANPIDVTLKNLGTAINSNYADYSPVITADQKTLLFTSRRPETTGNLKDEDGNFMEDIYISTKTDKGWTNALNIGAPINTDEHEATVGISPDGQTILIYKDDKGDGNIYQTTLNGDIWGAPIKLNEQINSKYWEPSAFISADGNTIYFTSNRPGGYGGRDLYSSKKTPKGDWGKAINMGPKINTIYDEDAPFIHPDGISLSFSSNGHLTMGGFDIFTSVLNNHGEWLEPENMGYPINTTDDDIFFMMSPDGLKAYFSSFRKDGLGEKDNYEITFLNKKEKPLTLMKGTVVNELGTPAKDIEIIVTDNATEEIVGIYHPNSKTGQYVFILTPGKNYNITYHEEGYLFHSENWDIPMETNYYEIYKAIILKPIVIGSTITLNNIFFDFDKSTLRDVSKVEIKNLVALMMLYPKMKIEIAGHTDNKGIDAYNLKLSNDRAQAVVTQLIANNVSKKRMKAKGYGESTPVAENQKKDSTDNPEGRQLNRRVELKVTAID